ncbi:histone PARylation factor 1 [Orussus abietinus]|uniref:histone PARylation factor 1 n=1 Tax=Orussus abietinus TaxID=222816 RepID=UPI0006253391|nr:histone PARylation factor 1 [Orussus abietinus]XP_012279933.1 histone PARylation factor 1 [Orussus abietinus]XP_023289889.1 histone PARylation factor 1 [Orussus abietinus]
MPSDINSYEEYKNDPRTACQFGVKCYQKNPAHHSRYKHPPKEQNQKKTAEVNTSQKRKSCDDEKESRSKLPRADHTKKDETKSEVGSSEKVSSSPEKLSHTTSSSLHNMSPSPESNPVQSNSDTEEGPDSAQAAGKSEDVSSSTVDSLHEQGSRKESPVKKEVTANEEESSKAATTTEENSELIGESRPPANIHQFILEIFSVEMPEDFYKLYDLCSVMSPKKPLTAFNMIGITLVGPYDVLSGKIDKSTACDKEKFFRHWRYYYDPPEFQTIMQVSGKDGLHFGYWRDEPTGNPVFVAKNNGHVDCKFTPVAENIFGALDKCIGEKLKGANPFEKMKLLGLQRQVNNFAKKHGFTLESNTEKMKAREKKVVARTFHGAGIVVPYDKKTQLGYREMAVTDVKLRSILKKMDEAESSEERQESITHLEEVIRLATIAADECDFGTCLELGQNLFSSGYAHLENHILHMLSTAYAHLNRKEFNNILKAHLKDRKKGADLSVV